jgi:hypothetical protein
VPDIDDQAIGVERYTTDRVPEVELVVISLHGNVADLLLDDGEMLRFDIAELRRALEQAA